MHLASKLEVIVRYYGDEKPMTTQNQQSQRQKDSHSAG